MPRSRTDRILKAAERAAQLAHLQRRVRGPALHPAQSDHAGERHEPGAEMGVPGQRHRRVAVVAAGGRRHHVRHAAAERRDGARREDRPRVLDLPSSHAGRSAGLLRLEQPRRRDARQHPLHGHARRQAARARCADRPQAVGSRHGRVQERVLDHHGAAHRQRQGARRHRRRRVRRARLHGGVRREDRQGIVALLHDSRPRRARPARRGRPTHGRPAADRCG